jgi:hypothetical protein
MQAKPEGWILYALGVTSLLASERSFSKDFGLIYLSVGLLGMTPITTDTSFGHIISMSTTLGLAVLLPYLVVRFVYREDSIRYGTFLTRKWTRGECLWILFTLVLGYILLPYYLKAT